MADTTIERLQAIVGDRYTIERELGRGGMATVFLATDAKHGRQVAIKVLHPELSISIGGDRFEREIRLAAKLQHPHILGLYDSGVADGLLYYVMPFVEGESLRDRIDREGQLTVDDAVQIALEVADALGHAHAQNIVHRDIKPENILLSNGHALVADFGIARAVEEGGQKLTQTGMAVGTPAYMAPEQAVGENVGPTADLYSLGCVLYEMLAGEPPFTARNAAAIMARHAMETVPSIRIVRQSVPDEVEEAIFAAMGKVPADRPQTAAHFAEILGVPMGATATRRAALRHTTSRRIPTPSRAYRAAEEEGVPIWRRPWALALAAVLVLGGGFTAWQLASAGGGRPPGTAGGLDPKRIAVLYFDDVSGPRNLGDLADGLTEGLIQSLAQVQGLSVVSRTGVAPYRGTGTSPDSIARALGSGTLVRGTVEQQGDRLRVSVRLLDGNSGADLGERASFERASADPLGARDTLAVEVARLIRARIGAEVRLREQRSASRNAEAWLLVQRAERLRKRGEVAAAQNDTLGRRRDFTAADSLLALAEDLDPQWPDPKLLRGLIAYRWSRLSGRDRAVIQEWVNAGLGHVERALALDAGNADALELRGNLRYWSVLMRLDPDTRRLDALRTAAREDLEAATRSNPNQAGAWASLSHVYTQTGTPVDVNLAARRALEADAFLENAEVVMSRLFLSSYDLGQFRDAGHWCAETRRRFPGEFAAPRCELFMLTTSDREPDAARAWRLADSVAQLAPQVRREYLTLHSNMLVAAVLARAGLKDSAAALIERSKGDADMNPTRDLALFGAAAYAQMQEAGKAVDLLKLYVTANPDVRTSLSDDPGWWFRRISQDPRFRQLVTGS